MRAITAPATDAARQWDGWGTALKPACELIVLARKPLSEGTVAANVLRWGTGAINVDGCRVGTVDRCASVTQRSHWQVGQGRRRGRTMRNVELDPDIGRWPANVAHDGSDEVTAAFPESESTPFRANDVETALHGGGITHRSAGGFADTGSAARFFSKQNRMIHAVR